MSDLAAKVLEAMDMDSGPVEAEPYASWAKALALEVLELEARVAYWRQLYIGSNSLARMVAGR